MILTLGTEALTEGVLRNVANFTEKNADVGVFLNGSWIWIMESR